MPLTRKLYCLVGLIMGTRMWYSFWDAEKDDNAAFERRVDQVLREVGERGRPIVAESVPPQTRVKRPLGPSVTAAALDIQDRSRWAKFSNRFWSCRPITVVCA